MNTQQIKTGDKVVDTRAKRQMVGKVIAVTERSILVRFGNDDAIYDRESDGDAQYLSKEKTR